MKALFKAKLVSTGELVEGTYHYSNDGKYHYILNRECFLERTYDSGNEMALKKEEVHLVDGDSVIQITDDSSVYCVCDNPTKYTDANGKTYCKWCGKDFKQ